MSKMSKAIAVLGVVAGLGVAAMPLSSYAANYSQSTSAIVSAEVGGAISIAVEDVTGGAYDSATNTLKLGELTLGGDVKAASLNVKVATNSTKEDATANYKLQMTMETTETALVNENGQKIEAGTPAKGTSAWGYTTDDIATNLAGATWKQVPAKGQTAAELKANGTANNTGETTKVSFGASASPTQAQGVYSGTVVFTAVVGE